MFSPTSASSRRGFTLIELMMVIAIIALLSGTLWGIVPLLRENARRNLTRAMVQAVATAALTYQPHVWRWTTTAGAVRSAPLFDIDGDFKLDGTPGDDQDFGAGKDPNAGNPGVADQPTNIAGAAQSRFAAPFTAPTVAEANAGGYGGFLAMTGADIPGERRKHGTVEDSWHQTLKLRWAPTGTDVLVWSIGKDGRDQSADPLDWPTKSDDLRSWVR